MVVASSSVAHVSTRIDSSLSSAASTVFWWVSGTLRIQPRCSEAGGPQPSAARAARASRNVSLSVSMMRDAGIDSGMPVLRGGLSYPNHSPQDEPVHGHLDGKRQQESRAGAERHHGHRDDETEEREAPHGRKEAAQQLERQRRTVLSVREDEQDRERHRERCE